MYVVRSESHSSVHKAHTNCFLARTLLPCPYHCAENIYRICLNVALGFYIHYGFLGEVLFKSNLPGVVFEVGFYLLAHMMPTRANF